MNKRYIGTEKEELASEYLMTHGVNIVDKNFRIRQGEIDLIGYDGAYLVFVEVKYRKGDATGYPEESVGFYKQKRICRAADSYRIQKGISTSQDIRYDVLAIEGEEIRWIKNAFPHIYSQSY